MNRRDKLIIVAAALAAVRPIASFAGESQNTSGPTQQGVFPAITISLSGQVALRNFTANPGISTLRPNASSTFYFGPTGIPVTYYAADNSATYVQLAKKDFTTADSGLGATSIADAPIVQGHSALRVEWHEQGSVQGVIDLINDQIGYTTGVGGTGILSNVDSRGPSVSNQTWVNGNAFQTGGTISGHFLAGGNFGDTYDTSVYERISGRNLQGGQNRIQYAQGEYKTENFAVAGVGTYSALPGQSGFGQGNPALAPGPTVLGLGNAGGRQSFYPESIANQSTDKVNPESASDETYTSGPWNTAGANNIDSKQYAVTAVTYSANPGTGLAHAGKEDLKWLLTAGRLQNGADFNVVSRANDAGQRTVPAVNVGVDPSWAVGENDDGNTSGTAAQNAQRTLGSDIRFSGKTSGTDARSAISQSRLAIGPLSIAETRGAASNAPIRALAVDFENDTFSSNPADFTEINYQNLIDFKYKAILISHINTIKAPRPDLLAAYLSDNPGATPQQVQDWWNGLSSEVTGIKGDQFGNVRSFVQNITESIGTAEAGGTFSSVNNPADALYLAGYTIPGLLNKAREYDGGPITDRTLTPAQLEAQANVGATYGPLFGADGTSGSASQTIGANSFYGALNAGNSGSLALNGGSTSLLITAKDASGNPVANGVAGPKGNYLFGNFNQDGRRDFASVKESVNAVLSLRAVDGANNSIYTADGGVSNSTVVPSLAGSPGWATTANTKGDLIVLGDFNSDGAFDGKDVYLLARGASLSDNAGTDHLTNTSGPTFGDQVRNPNARLNKNAALDYIAVQTSGDDPDKVWLRTSSQSTLQAANDPAGLNAFNKADINRDGLIDRKDAQLVDHFVGKDYRNLDHVLAATIARENGTVVDGRDISGVAVTETPAPLNLVEVELTDSGDITHVLSGGTSDFKVIREALGNKLIDGDADFNGIVDVADLGTLASNWQTPVDRWSLADFDFNGLVDVADLGLLASNWQQTAAGASLSEALAAVGLGGVSVPEPGALTVLAITFGAARRRARRVLV